MEKSYGRLKVGQQFRLSVLAKRCDKLKLPLRVETSHTGTYLQLDMRQAKEETVGTLCTIVYLQTNICYIKID